MSTILPYLSITISGCFFLYFILLWIYCGRIPAFGWFWPLAGVILIGIRSLAIWPVITILPLIIFAAGAIILSWNGNRKPSPGADYVIVLGAHVNGTIPSKALISRILTACQYLTQNPETKAVLTGGQGIGEEITEALCMKQELQKLGIPEERILLEDKSTTTKENISFASKIIRKELSVSVESVTTEEEKNGNGLKNKSDSYILIVTNDFHTLRGGYLAKQIGYQHVETLGASSSLIMKPHYYTREILSWIKLILSRFLAHFQ